MKLSDKIRIIRKARGFSQEALGEKLSRTSKYGISRQAVSDWENGKSEPKLENVRDLADVLQVSFDTLLDESIDLDNPQVLVKALEGMDVTAIHAKTKTDDNVNTIVSTKEKSKQEKRDEFYAAHECPQVPMRENYAKKKAFKKAKIEYKHAKKRYDKAKEGKTPAVILWLDLHKVSLIIIFSLIALLTAALCVGIHFLKNNNDYYLNAFDIDKLEKIEIGDTEADIKELFGEPDIKTSAEYLSYYDGRIEKVGTVWQYYGEEYREPVEKLKEHQKKKSLIDENSYGQYLEYVEKERKFQREIDKIIGSYTEVIFDESGKVIQVFFDTKLNDDAEKLAYNVELSTDRLLYSSELTYVEIFSSIYYNDESYKLMYVPYEAYKDVDTKKYYQHQVQWSDDITTYSAHIMVVQEIHGNIDGVSYSIYYGYRNTFIAITLSGSGHISAQNSIKAPWNLYKGDVVYVSVGENVTLDEAVFDDFEILWKIEYLKDLS